MRKTLLPVTLLVASALLVPSLTQAQSTVVINEFLADNDSIDRDEGGDFEDWVELYNRGTTTYDLTDHYLSDDFTNAKKWKFPPGTKIAPGAFLRIWCDDEALEGPLHANFKLSDDGEEIGLFAPDTQSNVMLDGIKFDKQKGDRSFGRLPDGAATFYYLYAPTGGRGLYADSSFVRYDTRRTGSATNANLKGSGQAKVSYLASIDVEDGPASGIAVVVAAALPWSLDLGPLGYLNIDLGTLVVLGGVALDANGAGHLTFTVPSVLGGGTVYFQSLVVAADLTNAVAVQFEK